MLGKKGGSGILGGHGPFGPFLNSRMIKVLLYAVA